MTPRNSRAGKLPSPRLASVMGQRPAAARVFANALISASVVWVAWMMHQRRSTGAAGRSWVADDMGSMPFAWSALHGSLPGFRATIAQ